MRKEIMLAIAGLAVLSGCRTPENKPAASAQPKWQGATYHLAFDAKAAKPSAAGVTIPMVKFSANPEELQRRATLVVRFDVSGGKKDAPVMNQMIMAPTDVTGPEGALAADYMDATNKELAQYLGSYCLKGKVKISVALARSSLNPQASEAELDTKRISDWLPIELDFKNPHPKC
ncbi:MAG TPA: hypothetical protein VGJ21_08070 [Terracidiphilus sp.]